MIYLEPSLNRWAAGTIVISLFLIVVLTLAPFNFDFEGGVAFAEIASRFSHRSSTDDWIANVLLYLPLGFSLAAWLWIKRVSESIQFACVLLFAFSLSAAVEVLQVFLDSRVSASTDIYANSVGAVLGFLGFNYWGRAATFSLFLSIEKSIQRFIQRRIAGCPIRNMTFILVGYISILFFVSSSLHDAIHLRNWTQPYFLLLGNDQSIGSPWKGYLAKVSIADQTISEPEVAQVFARKALPASLQDSLVAVYDLASHRSSYSDQTGNSPKLIWRGNSIQTTDENGSLLNSTQWLESETEASFINQKVRRSSQFALSTVLATADIEQTSAPILSLSNQASERRNLAFAQHGTQLVLWLRTSVNNTEGTNPELVIPNVFTDTNFHHLLITYHDSLLHIYVDGLQKQVTFDLNPGITVFRKLLPLEKFRNAGLTVCKVLYYALLFVPLGILTGLVVTLSKRRLTRHVLLIIESVLLAPFAFELLMSVRTGQEPNLTSFLLGASFTAAAVLVILIDRRLQGLMPVGIE
jgi:glycopeptide antibiotics resistance protein